MGTRHLLLPTPAGHFYKHVSHRSGPRPSLRRCICHPIQGLRCDTPPCTVKSGSKFPISMTFTPDHDIADLTAGVYAEIGGLDIPWPNFNNKACEKMVGEQCPLKKGVPATWTYEVFVDPLYPKMTVMAKFELKDNTGLQTCMEIPVVIEA